MRIIILKRRKMRKLKLIVMVAFSIVFISNVIQAQTIKQDQHLDNKDYNKQMRVNEKDLNLLDGQKEPYREIINRHDKKQKEILDGFTDKKERQEKMKQAEISRNKELKNVLTEEQFERYLKLDAEKQKEIKQETKKKQD